MLDSGLIITIVPPVFAALIAYAIARIKSGANERIQRAKIEAEFDNRSLDMMRSVVEDMKVEMRKEINLLKTENQALKEEMVRNKEEIETLRRRLHTSTELQDAMRVEINSLKNTIQWYEKKLKEVEGSVNGNNTSH